MSRSLKQSTPCCKDRGLISPGFFRGMEAMLAPCTDFGHPLPFSAQIGGEKKKWWPVRHRPAPEYRLASVLAAAFLAQGRGKGDELAGEEGLSHSPSPPFQRTENPSSAPQSSVEHSWRFVCSRRAVSRHVAVPHHRRNGVSETLRYKEVVVLKLLTNVL